MTEPSLDVGDQPCLDGIALPHPHGDRGDRRALRHLDRAVPVPATSPAAHRLRVAHRVPHTAGPLT